MLLAVVGALMGWRGVFASLFGGSVVGSVIGITGLLLARRRTPAEGDGPTLMKTELPFGPFLTTAAVFYLFAEPWVTLHFRFGAG
jgi:leader peptidase (prepilin peptidase)/N-methyltransferase